MVFLQLPLVAVDRRVDGVDPALSTLAWSAVRIFLTVQFVELFCNTGQVFGLAVTLIGLRMNFRRYALEQFGFLGSPAGFVAAFLLNKQPTLLALLLGPARHEDSKPLPIFSGKLLVRLLLLQKLNENHILQ